MQKLNTNKRIYLDVILWIVVSAFVFLYFFPALVNSLLALQDSHETQVTEISDLKAQAQSTHTMQEDINAVETSGAQPSTLFTSDVQLVTEIQHIEAVAKTSGVVLTLTLTGSADKAPVLKGSASGLLQVKYSMKIVGSFAAELNFLSYLENSYFVSPVNGINMTWDDTDKNLSTTIFVTFFLHK